MIANWRQAIAVVTRFLDDEDEDHLAQDRARAENAEEAFAGAQAVITTRELSVPCAQAPSLTPLDVDESGSESGKSYICEKLCRSRTVYRRAQSRCRHSFPEIFRTPT